jgi:REP element-mobilizing transposase RayT
MNSTKIRRKPLRLRDYDYAEAGMYFVTICTHDRACLFGSIVAGKMCLNVLGGIIGKCWRALPTQYPQVSLDAFVVMPNHIHGIIVFEGPSQGAINRAPTLGEVVRGFKARCTHAWRDAIPHDQAALLWQRNYYEHVIRNESDLHRAREYIENNPAQWAMDWDNPTLVSAR